MWLNVQQFLRKINVFDSTLTKLINDHRQNIAIGASSLGFNYRAGQNGHSVVTGLPPPQYFFGGVLPSHAAQMEPGTCYTMKVSFFWFD